MRIAFGRPGLLVAFILSTCVGCGRDQAQPKDRDAKPPEKAKPAADTKALPGAKEETPAPTAPKADEPDPKKLAAAIKALGVTDAGYIEYATPPYLQVPVSDPKCVTADGKLDPKIVEELKKAKTVQLWIKNLPFKDDGMADMKAIPGLTHLFIYGSEVGDTGIAHLASMKQLKAFSLDKGKLTDKGCPALADLTNLTWLELQKNQVGDAGLTSLKNLKNLKWLELSGNRFSGKGLSNLAGMTNLETLRLNLCPIDDTGLEGLKTLAKLNSLMLGRTKITDAGLKHLVACKELKSLSLAETSVTDAGLDTLAELKNLDELILTYDTKTTEKGQQRIKKALPKLEIKFGMKAFIHSDARD